MFLIVGLGNPGPQYVGTRHNAGFELLDFMADEAAIEINKNKFKSMIGEGFVGGKKAVLMKPMTFMNLSGEAVVQALNFYKPKPTEFIVVYDDMALRPGAVRIRERGSAGGHNGMKSIIGLTGTEEFTRVRIGVGGARGNVISHVLGKFSKEEEELYVQGLGLAREAVKTIMTQGVAEAMNKYNSSGKPEKPPKPAKALTKGSTKETGKEIAKEIPETTPGETGDSKTQVGHLVGEIARTGAKPNRKTIPRTGSDLQGPLASEGEVSGLTASVDQTKNEVKPK